VPGALADAVQLCWQTERPLPGWLGWPVVALLEWAEGRMPAAGRGRLATRGQRHEQDLVDYARWRAVRLARAYQALFRRTPVAKREAWPDPGRSWERAYEFAVQRLAEIGQACSVEAVKHSYRRVSRNLRAGRHALYTLTSRDSFQG
jgi:hypothetical protein